MSTRAKKDLIETQKRYSKAKPLSAKIGVCSKSLFRWADAGLISKFKVNSRVVLFDEGEVETFIQSSRVRS